MWMILEQKLVDDESDSRSSLRDRATRSSLGSSTEHRDSRLLLIVSLPNAPYARASARRRAQSWAAMGIGEAIRAGATNQPVVPSSLRDCLDCLSLKQ